MIHQELLEVHESIGDLRDRLSRIGSNRQLCKADMKVLGLTIFARQALDDVTSYVKQLLEIFPATKQPRRRKTK